MAKRSTYQKRARRGRCAPAPYTKKQKQPHQYSGEYHAWRARFVRKSREAA